MDIKKFKFLKFILCLVISAKIFAFDFFTPFKEAEKGDYIILTINKTYTCLSIFERTENRLVLEELTFLQSKLNPKEAKKHFENLSQPASHTILEIDIDTKACTICYDVLNRMFLDPKGMDSILLRLFELDFKLMKKDERRKVGVLDLESPFDNRPVWNPSYYFQGESVKGRTCEGFRAIIPQDIKYLGGKFVEMYIDPKLKGFCFPVWLQIADDAAAFKVIPVDMGKNFQSKMSKLPRPLPCFASQLNHQPSSILFEFETTYPIQSHRFFFYDLKTLKVIPAKINKKEKIRINRYAIELESLPQKSGEHGIYSTLEEEKDLIIECIQSCKF